MNKAMIASMREQLRPSEAARTALLERVGEIPNKQEGNSVTGNTKGDRDAVDVYFVDR